MSGLGGQVFCHSNLSSTCGAWASLAAGAWAVVLGLVWVGSAGYLLVLGGVVGGDGGLVYCHYRSTSSSTLAVSVSLVVGASVVTVVLGLNWLGLGVYSLGLG